MNEHLSRELVGVLRTVIDESRNHFYVINLNLKPIKDSYKSIGFLVDQLRLQEEYADKITERDTQDEEYQFLKQILEQNIPLVCDGERIFTSLGITRERSKMSKPNRHEIAAQIFAQILWDVEAGTCSTIEAVILRLQDKENAISCVFGLQEFHKEGLRNWISPVYPVPLEQRKVPGYRVLVFFKGMRLIPSIFSKQGINFQKLRFAAQVVAYILKHRDWPLEVIVNSRFIGALANPLPECLRIYVKKWAEEAFWNTGIFNE